MGNKTAVPDAPDVPVAESEDPITLEEFCANLSVAEGLFEMIAAFDHVERAAGRLSAMSSTYKERWTAFKTALPKKHKPFSRR